VREREEELKRGGGVSEGRRGDREGKKEEEQVYEGKLYMQQLIWA